MSEEDVRAALRVYSRLAAGTAPSSDDALRLLNASTAAGVAVADVDRLKSRLQEHVVLDDTAVRRALTLAAKQGQGEDIDIDDLKWLQDAVMLLKIGDEALVAGLATKLASAEKSAFLSPSALGGRASGDGLSADITRLDPGPSHVGLRNLGNRCFMDSLVQAMRFDPTLQHVVVHHGQPGIDCGGPCTICVLRRLFDEFRNHEAPSPLSPWYLSGALKTYLQYEDNEERDVVELYEKIITGLDSINLHPTSDDAAFRDQKRVVLRVDWNKQCLVCMTEEPSTSDKVAVLAVDVKRAGLALDTLTEALNLELASDQRDLDCSCCGQRTRHTRTMTGMRTPDVLVVHLRRFEQTGTQARKIPGIRFGNILSLSHWTDNLEDDYRLDAVIQHYGDSIDTGHYDCSRAAQGGYIRFNDEEVTFHPEPLESVFENAYMLIFSRKSVAPELPLFSQQPVRPVADGFALDDEPDPLPFRGSLVEDYRELWLHPSEFRFATCEEYIDLVMQSCVQTNQVYEHIVQACLGKPKPAVLKFFEKPGILEGVARAKVEHTLIGMADVIRKGKNATLSDYKQLPDASTLTSPMNYFICVSSEKKRPGGKLFLSVDSGMTMAGFWTQTHGALAPSKCGGHARILYHDHHAKHKDPMYLYSAPHGLSAHPDWRAVPRAMLKNGDLGWIDGVGCLIQLEIAGHRLSADELGFVLRMWESTTILEMGSLAPEEAAARGTASSVIADFGLNVMFFDFGNRDLPNEARYGSRHAARLRGHELGKVKGADISRYMKEGLELAKPVLKFRHDIHKERYEQLRHGHSVEMSKPETRMKMAVTRQVNMSLRYLVMAASLLATSWTTPRLQVTYKYRVQPFLLGEQRPFGTPKRAVKYESAWAVTIVQEENATNKKMYWWFTYTPCNGPHHDEGKFWRMRVEQRYHSINNAFLDLRAVIASDPPPEIEELLRNTDLRERLDALILPEHYMDVSAAIRKHEIYDANREEYKASATKRGQAKRAENESRWQASLEDRNVQVVLLKERRLIDSTCKKKKKKKAAPKEKKDVVKRVRTKKVVYSDSDE